MSKRVSIVIDDDLDKKIRAHQAKIIKKQNSPHSFSKTVNDLIRQAI